MSTPTALPPVAPAPRDPSQVAARRQQGLLALGRRAVLRPAPLELMQDAASLLASMLDAEHTFLAQLESAGHVLALQFASTYPEGIQGAPTMCNVPAEPTRSLAGYAIQAGQSTLVTDLRSENRFQDPILAEHSVRAALAVLLGLPNRPFGVLAVATGIPRSFSKEDVTYAETVAQLATMTVAWGRAEQSLVAQQRRSQRLLETVQAMVLVLDADGRILEANRTCQELSGYSFDEIHNRFLWNAFPVAQELELFETIFPQLLHEGTPVKYESNLLTKNSHWRQIAWSCSAIRDETGAIDTILATGIDVTEQRLAEEKTLGVEAAAERAFRLLPQPVEAQRLTNSPDPVAPPLVERRRRQRRSYPYQQMIAPVFDGNLPMPRDFFRVQCRDISAGGLAFLSATPLDYNALVVALGTPPALTHLHAQVRHVTEICYQGTQAYVVGCAYTGRVFY